MPMGSQRFPGSRDRDLGKGVVRAYENGPDSSEADGGHTTILLAAMPATPPPRPKHTCAGRRREPQSQPGPERAAATGQQSGCPRPVTLLALALIHHAENFHRLLRLHI